MLYCASGNFSNHPQLQLFKGKKHAEIFQIRPAFGIAGRSPQAHRLPNEKAAAMVNGVSIPASTSWICASKSQHSKANRTPRILRKAIRDDLINSGSHLASRRQRTAWTNNRRSRSNWNWPDRIRTGGRVRTGLRKELIPLRDDVLKQEYESLKKRVGNKEYKLSHILVQTEDEAKKVEAELKKRRQIRQSRQEQEQRPRLQGQRRRSGLDRTFQVSCNLWPMPFSS